MIHQRLSLVQALSIQYQNVTANETASGDFILPTLLCENISYSSPTVTLFSVFVLPPEERTDLWAESRALSFLGKRSTTEPNPQPLVLPSSEAVKETSRLLAYLSLIRFSKRKKGFSQLTFHAGVLVPICYLLRARLLSASQQARIHARNEPTLQPVWILG